MLHVIYCLHHANWTAGGSKLINKDIIIIETSQTLTKHLSIKMNI